MWVVGRSDYPNDIPEGDTILASVTPRRLQRFRPEPARTYSWRLVRVSDGATLQEGTVQADSTGVLTVSDLPLSRAGRR